MRSPSASQRNRQVVRQWLILQRLASARAGSKIHSLAVDLGVTTRTIRRDLEALQEAGFPLVDAIDDDDRRAVWRLLAARELPALSASRNANASGPHSGNANLERAS